MLKATLCLLLGLSKATSRTYGYDLVATPQPPLEPIAFGAVPDFPTFTIDLDAPAKDRFKEPALHFREDIISTFVLYME